jgi:thiol:disulfide interchange protein
MWYNKAIERFKAKPWFFKITSVLRLVLYVSTLFLIEQRLTKGTYYNTLLLFFIGLSFFLDGTEKFKTNRTISIISFIFGFVALFTVYLIK